MSKQIPFSMKDIIEKSIRETFEQVIATEMDRMEKMFEERLRQFVDSQKMKAKKEAEKMTLEMLHMMDNSKISIEFRL